MRTGITQAPLHGGHCPPWLFQKIRRLSSVMLQVIVLEYGTAEVLRRFSDPVWFQTFGCVLGFDWHSSGLTTVVCGAVKEGMREMQGELGLFFAGGKGSTSRKTPLEIKEAGERYGLANELTELERTSRMVAKVDSAAVQDGYQLYHHFFIFDKNGSWAVVQQGMNQGNNYARRYHWLSDGLTSFVEEPHRGICGLREKNVLNLVALDNQASRLAAVELCREKPEKLTRILRKLSEPKHKKPQQISLWSDEGTILKHNNDYPKLTLPSFHPIPAAGYLSKMLFKLYDIQPQNFASLLEIKGVGAGTLRALTMVAEVTHGAAPSFADPVRYTFAHGGKDGFPFPVNRKDMEHSIVVLEKAIKMANLGDNDKLTALRKLAVKEKELLQKTV